MPLNLLPTDFREGHDGSLACPHRDISCCAACVDAHAEIVDVMGAAFWVADPIERAALLAEMGENERILLDMEHPEA